MGERNYLLPEKGRYFKANLHSHTTISDGRMTPEEAKAAYRARGYQVMAFTDHRIYRDHNELDDEEFVTIPAVEVDINEISPERLHGRDRTYHINLFDTRPDYRTEEKEAGICPECRYEDKEYINSYIRKMKELGFIACYNHPYWSLQTYEEYSRLEGIFAIEIYNHGCEGDGMYGYNPQVYDEMLRLGRRIFCLATDDNHNAFPFDDPLSDSFGGFVMICAESLTRAAVTEALVRGDFYSSMGPEIRELYIEKTSEGDELVVKTSPARRIYAITAGKSCHRAAAEAGKLIDEARFRLTGHEGYIRIRVDGGDGKYADSNAYFL